MDCHKEIRADVTSLTGFHGRIAKDQPQLLCKNCHTEHKGRDADIVGLDRIDVRSRSHGFPAARRSRGSRLRCVPRARQAVPRSAGRMRRVSWRRAAAHEAPRRKVRRLPQRRPRMAGRSLRSFEDGVRSARRAHRRRLQDVATSTKCGKVCRRPACRAIARDDVHRGSRGTNCAACHNTTKWTGAAFDHLKQTGFALVGRHKELVCGACHLDNMAIKKPPKDCNGCHSADDHHRGRFGTDCARLPRRIDVEERIRPSREDRICVEGRARSACAAKVVTAAR